MVKLEEEWDWNEKHDKHGWRTISFEKIYFGSPTLTFMQII